MRDESIAGIPLSYLNGGPEFELNYVPEEIADKPASTIDFAAKFRPYEAELEDHWGYGDYPYYKDHPKLLDDPERLQQKLLYFPLDPYFSEFTFEDLAKIAFQAFIESEVTKAFDRQNNHDGEGDIIPPEPAEFVNKIRLSIWHFDYRFRKNWNDLVTAYYAIPQFNFGEGFEVYFDHARKYNEWGRAQHVLDQIERHRRQMPWAEYSTYYSDNVLYLDGMFGYLIRLDARHVLTIGFNLAGDRIFICQVQLRNAKGNRWVFDLPTDLLNYSVERMYEHFAGWGYDVFFVEGASLADKIATQHNEKDPLPEHVKARIAAFYSQPLRSFSRGKTCSRKNLVYRQLLPI